MPGLFWQARKDSPAEGDDAFEVFRLREEVEGLDGGEGVAGGEQGEEVAHLGGGITANIHDGAGAIAEELAEEILGVTVRKVVIPVAAGRNLAVLLEAAVRNYILQLRGKDSAAEFLARQKQAMEDSN